MALADVVSISISASTLTPTGPSFGTTLIASYHTHYLDYVRSYSTLSALVADGFLATGHTYAAVQAAFAQTPRPASVLVGRRATQPTQVVTLVVQSDVVGQVFTINVNGTAYSYTATGAEAGGVNGVATAWAAVIGGASGIASAAASTATITVTSTAGLYNRFSGWDPTLTKYTDTSTDPGLAADLTAINTANPNWYGLVLSDGTSKVQIQAAAAWAQSNSKFFGANTGDWACGDSTSTTDVLYVLKASAYNHTLGMFYEGDNYANPACAWLASQLTYTPGKNTWAYKVLTGVTVNTLTPTRVNAVVPNPQTGVGGKNASVYTAIASVNVTQYGMCSSGDWADTIIFIDWVQAQMGLAIFTLFANNPKVPYTAGGEDMVQSVMTGVMDQGVTNGGFVKGTTSVSLPDITTLSTSQKNSRALPNVTFQGKIAGAIHALTLQGNLST